MEISSVIHITDESFCYKLKEHKYIIKLITKKNDFVRVRFAYLEKYIREKNMPFLPSDTFYCDMHKVAQTERNDYYEVEISDEILLTGIKERIENIKKNTQALPPFALKMADEALKKDNTMLSMLSLSYYFILEDANDTIYYGNYKFFKEEPSKNVLDMFNMVFHQVNASYFKTPDWSQGAVIYQIFPERFAPTYNEYSSEWFNAPMSYKTRTNGTLEGIRERIPYLKELGVDAIYMTPIFLANSSHRYDTIDYMEIDPPLGTKEEFKSLVDELHKNGIRILLDLVFNHSSANFFAFQDLLKNQEASIYKDWYFIEKFPVEMKMPSDYMGFSFSPWMPKLNTSNPSCRSYLLDVSRYYLKEFGVDGYRLDVANEVTHDFWIEFRKACKAISPDCLLMGEIWYDSRTYLRGDQFDSVMNYTYFDAIRGLLEGKYTKEAFCSILERERGESSLTYFHNSNLLVGSHDTDRIYYAMGHNKELYMQAMTLLMTLPGSPILYYGDEKMMDGANDPDCRRGMIFDEDYNRNSFDFVKRLIKIKHRPCMKNGEIEILEDKSYLSFARYNAYERIFVFLNLEDKEISIDKFKGFKNIVTEASFDGILPPHSVLLLEA